MTIHPIPLDHHRRTPAQKRYRSRRGSITVLAAIMLTALLGVAALCINLTQIATSKTEIRLASDAAAKAGAVVLGQTQSIDEARQAAKQIAAKHRVSSEKMRIRNVDVEFGFSEEGDDGVFVFNKNQEPINAVRVNCRMDDGARSGKIDFFMKNANGTTDYSLDYTSTATRVDHDICLVVDRSGSMSWDMSNEEWKYPIDNGAAAPSIIQRYFEPPHPTLSRWAALTRASDIFFDHLDNVDSEIRVGLVSYSSNFVFGVYESIASTTESELTATYQGLTGVMQQIGTKELIGNTNVASGMQAAVRVLTGGDARITAKGTMVVLTDGIWNQGTDPVQVAVAAAAANITVHTITFSEQADQTSMIAVAAAGGGNHYHAPDESSLRDIFAQIAETLPTVLTE